MPQSRRTFIKQIGLTAGSLSFLPTWSFASSELENSFKLSLNPGAIGVSLTNQELIETAIKYGFQAIVPSPYEFKDYSNAQIIAYKDALRNNDLIIGAVGLPVQFRESDKKFDSDYRTLVSMLPKLGQLGISRMTTWIMPTHDKLNYEQNMALHASRLRAVAKELAQYNMKLGLEYVGPKTLKESKKYPFVSNMKEVKQLINVIGESNVGLQLDAFHWFCAGESEKDLLSLKAEEIITVDLNDAKAGRSRIEQLDWERELPTDSGVIDLKVFLSALKEIGYDGPMRAEPFNNELNNMEDQVALAKTKQSLETAMQLID